MATLNTRTANVSDEVKEGNCMEHVRLTEIQPQMQAILGRVVDDHEPIGIVLDQERGVVVVEEDDYKSLMETVYLLRNPVNAERLQEGIRQHRSGQRRVIDVTAYLDGNGA
jgi:antitoxin YefM